MQLTLIAGTALLLTGFVVFLPHILQYKPHPAVAPAPRDEAEDVLQLLADSPDPRQAGKAWQGLGALYERRGRLQSAARAFERAMAVGEAAEAELGRVQLARGDLVRAQAALEAARARERLDPDVLLLLGRVHKAAGRYTHAAALLHQAREHGDLPQAARALAEECDLLQLQRKLGAAKRKCELALQMQPLGDRDRPATERVLGLVYFFAGDQRARATHERAQRGYAKLGLANAAAWLREHVIDDLAETADEPRLRALSDEMAELVAALRGAEEPVWWRMSDAELRLADLLRKQHRWEAAEQHLAAAVAAFQRRPEGWETVPDYAGLFELQGLLARDQGRLAEARGAFQSALRVLEGNKQATFDTAYLRDEIAAATAKMADA